MTKTSFKYWLTGIALWLAAISAFVLYSVEANEQRLSDELETSGRTLHRLISQRVAQHDAHMTSLIALTGGAEPAPSGTIRQVMESITRFYPRIVWISLVSLGSTAPATPDSQKVTQVLKVPDGESEDLSPLRDAILEQERGKIGVYPSGSGHYLLAKRAPAPSDAAIILSVDTARLLEPEERPAWAELKLRLDGQLLLDLPPEDGTDTGGSFITAPHFESVIDGEKQRLVLSLDRPLSLATLLPANQMLGFATMSGLALFALMFALRQRSVALASQKTVREAEARGLLQERETLLAHASRVNAMGEMASGIAHELTQPLTAILSRSQAALRLAGAERPDIGPISEALQVNVREAKRAGEMLKRMRDYASNKAPKPVKSKLNGIIADIAALTSADLKQRGINLEYSLAAEPVTAVVDAIELEQVLHNLIRNAADALQDAGTEGGLIRIETQTAAGENRIIVSDNGPGIAPAALPNLFHPFFTTKPEGMGLGLSLCETLVERVDGRIEVENASSGGARFTITLPAAPAERDAP